MILLMRSVLTRIKNNPVRGVLTIVSISLGVAIVTLAFNLIQRHGEYYHLDAGKTWFTVFNGIIRQDRLLSNRWVFCTNDLKILEEEISELEIITPVIDLGWSRFQIKDDLYETQSVFGVAPEYSRLYDLKIVSGSFFTLNDMNEKNRVLVISKQIAEIVFGKPEEAIGQTVSMQDRVRRVNFKIIGVFDLLPSKQEALGIAHILMPYTLRAIGEIVNQFIGVAKNQDISVLRSKVTASLTRIHGPETQVTIWEGDPVDPFSNKVQAMRNQPKGLSITFASFGMVALLVSSLGVFTMMMVDILERTREIGLRRALGSTKQGIVISFLLEAEIISVMGSIIGLVLAFIFNQPVIAAIKPTVVDAGIPVDVSLPPLLGLKAMGLSVLAAIMASALLGLFPAIQAARVAPVESLREGQ